MEKKKSGGWWRNFRLVARRVEFHEVDDQALQGPAEGLQFVARVLREIQPQPGAAVPFEPFSASLHRAAPGSPAE